MQKLPLSLLLISLVLPIPASAQSKSVVAIGQIQTAAQNISCDGWDRSVYDCNADLSEGFRIMLETSIIKTGKMDVMERSQVDKVLTEQGLGEMGLTDSGGTMGGLKGIDYMVYGTITRFGSQEKNISISTSQGIGRALGSRSGGLSSSKRSISMGIDLKLTDVSTGQIRLADEVSATIQEGSSFSVGGVSSSGGSADPFADVQRIVAAKIAEAVVTTKFPFKIIAVQSDGTLVLNYGNVFLKPGDVLAAFTVGETFVDPDTGEVLGSEQTEIGSVQITSSDTRLSRATIASGEPGLFQAGTQLKRSQTAQASTATNQRKRSGAEW